MKRISQIIALLLITASSYAANFTVTRADGNGWTAQAGSFLAAINAANGAGAGPHTIVFSIPDNSTIVVDAPIPTLSASNVTIDGTTKNLTIRRNANWGTALKIAGNNNTIANLTFVNNTTVIGAMSITGDFNIARDNDFTSGGLWVGEISPFDRANNNQIINTTRRTLNGTLNINGDNNTVDNIDINGVLILGVFSPADYPANDNTVTNVTVKGDKFNTWDAESFIINGDRNQFLNSQVIGGEGGTIQGEFNIIDDITLHVDRQPVNNAALLIQGPSNNNQVINSSFTLDPNNVTVDNLNNVDGIKLFDGSDQNVIRNNNLEGNFWNGILMRQAASNNTIQDNHSFDNKNHGIFIFDNSIGNTLIDNTVHGNAFSGVSVHSSTTNIIRGTITHSNTFNGIAFESGASLNQAFDNTVFNQPNGFLFDASNSNTIHSNVIGLDTLGNAAGNTAGITLQSGSSQNTIGNINQGNTVTNSTNSAIAIDGVFASQNTIRGNNTNCNGGPGIDHLDGGNANYGQGLITINWGAEDPALLSGKAATIGDIIDIYIAGTCHPTCTASSSSVTTANLAQGATWVASVTAINDGSGNAVWSLPLPAANATLDWSNAIVTATHPTNGNTSEFSICEFDSPCNPPTQASISAPADYCAGIGTTITATTDVSNYTFTWFRNNTEIASGTDLTPFDINQPGDYYVVIADPLDEALCFLQSNTITVTENPNPTTPVITGDDPVCFGGTGAYSIPATPAYATYTWGVSATGASVIGTGNSVSVNFGTAPASTYNVTLTVIDNNGCTSPEATLPVTVTALPQITAINGPTEACENETGVGPFTVTTVPASIPGAVYNWSATGGVSLLTPTAASTNADVTLAGAKTISVGITDDGNGCATAADFDVALTVNELPNVSAISGADAVCENTTGETYTVNSTVTGSTFDWLVTGATIDAPSTSNSIDISFTNTSADIQVTATANGCTGTASAVKTVTINALPITNAIVASDDSICLDQGSVTFSVAPGTAGSDYQWTVSDANAVVIGQGTETITVDFSASTPGSINISVNEISSALCESANDPDINVQVFDFPTLTGGITTSSPSPICNETGVTYSVNTGVTPLNWSFNWTVPAGATIVSGNGTASIVVDLGDQNGQIEVTAVNEAGCETIITPLPVSLSGCNLQANFAVVDSICFGETVTVTDLTSGDNIDSLVWNFGVNATPQTATSFTKGATVDVTFSTTGDQRITLTAYEGLATSTFTDTVKVNALPTTDTKLIVAPTSVCPNSDSVLVSLQGNYDPTITYTWDITPPSGATIISNPDSSDIYLNFTNVSPVTVSVTETATSGCRATSPTADITLFADPTPIVIQGEPNACQDVAQDFTISGGSGGTITWGIIPDTVSTTGVVGSGTAVSITFDNANPLQDIEITAVETSANGCTSTASNASFFVTIRPKPVVLSVEGDTTICAYGGTGNYNATGTDVDHFIWTIPSGATVATSNADSSNISLDFGVNNFSILVASAVSDFGCLSDAPAILQVTGEDIRPFDLLIGPNSCAEVTNILSITPEDSNATYDWQLVGGGVIIQGNTTDSIEVLNPAADYEVTIVAERKDIPGCQLTVGPRTISINELLDQIDLSVDYDFTPNVICDNDDERFDSLRSIASNVTIGDNNPLLTYKWTYNYAPSIVDSVLNVSSITDTLTGFDFGRNHGLHSFTVQVNNEKCLDSLEATIIVNIVESKPVDYNITPILSCIGDVDTVGIRNAHIATGHDDDVIYTWLHQEDSLITEMVQKTEPDGQGGTVINNYVEIIQWDTVGTPNFFGKDSILFVHYDTNFVGTNSGNEIFYDNYSFTGEFNDQLIVNADPQYCIIYDRNNVTKGENLLRDTLNPEIVSRPGAELGVYDLETFEYSGTVTPFDVDEFELSLDNPFSIDKIQDDFALEEITNRDTLLGYIFPTGQTDVSYEWSWFLNADDSIFTDNIVTTRDFPYLARPQVVGAPQEVSYMVKTSNGVCYDTAIVVININYVPWPPNAFSPNDDGSFDTWQIYNVEQFEGTTVTIFNRWGTELLKIEDYHLAENWWDGTKDGNALPTGTYFYLIDFNDGSEEVTGAVSIVK